MNAIELKNISKSFGSKKILSNFNCSIRSGEMIAITGPSGSGKSLLLNTIGLIEPIESGELFIEGVKAPNVETKKANYIIRNKISYLFQNFALVDNLTVEENLLMALKYTKYSKEQKNKIITRALKKMNLIDYNKQAVYELSGGEQQRIALARCMVKPSDIILADEPTGSLDHGNCRLVLKSLKEINDTGKTILIVTHDEHVANECDRIIDLANK